MAVLQNKTPCVETTHWRDRDGYGRVNPKYHNKTHMHHRSVWIDHYGPIPKGMLIRHLCHNPACINIEHLAIGTMKDNRQDDIDAGKPVGKGIANGRAKLNEQQINEIRSVNPRPDRTPRGLLKQVSEDYKVSKQMILNIWENKNWTHLP